MLKRISVIVGAFAFLYMLARPFLVELPVKEEEKPALPKVEEKPAPPPEKPLHNVALPNFGDIKDVRMKKQAFFSFIRPAVEEKNKEIMAQRRQVESMLEAVSLGEPLSAEQAENLAKLAKQYRVKSSASQLEQLHALHIKVDVIPSALVLVQAANESAWGTSRFARIGLNFFGIWCYKKGCGMVPRSRNAGANHEVQAFQSVDEAVTRYLNNINTNNAYIMFRAIRKQLREQEQPLIPEILATGLLPYSERGSDYVIELTDMLRHNQRYLDIPTISAVSP
ncbi:glucosaminidase domain-containing protein [Thalassotalea euphylliae]|uniref:glucosaminidase domain-containing protein n=1 Tax=Thalassotalea euphylliae TaxID=1655234 RepID=UPI003625A131